MQIQARSLWLKGRRRRALIAGALLSICSPGVGQAADPVAPALDTSACKDHTRERLQWLVERADSRELYADIWWRGWIGFYGAGMVIQGGRAGLENAEARLHPAHRSARVSRRT